MFVNFRTAGIKGGSITSASVRKDASVNFLYYGIRSGGVLSLEPFKNRYDLLFTQYTTLLFTSGGAAYPYLVTGVLLNPNGLKVAVDSVHAFAAIDLTVARTMSYKLRFTSFYRAGVKGYPVIETQRL
jgi:hypothetical protein